MLLQEIAEEAGYSASHVASLSGLHLSTVVRHWQDAQWFDHLDGASLRKLVASLPGVDEYLRVYPHLSRQQRLAEELCALGVEVDQEGIRHAVVTAGIAPARVSNALETAAQLLTGNVRGCVALLSACWSCEQDRATRALFAVDAPARLLQDREPVLRAAEGMKTELETGRGFSFPRLLAASALRHYLAIEGGERCEDLEAPIVELRYARDAFLVRGLYMGLIIRSGNLEYAERYRRLVERSPAARLVEAWSFPTYAGDRLPTADFTLERSIVLRRAAKEVLLEFSSYNDAYIWYLATTYLPLALEYDPTFGGQHERLTQAARLRMEQTAEAKVRAACEGLTKTLQSCSPN
jgi:hypothetical protein